MAAYVVMVFAFLLNSRTHITDLLKRTFLGSAASTTIDDSGRSVAVQMGSFGNGV